MSQETIITGIIAGFPNFLGFLILSYVLYLIVDRQLTMLEKMVEDCAEDDESDD